MKNKDLTQELLNMNLNEQKSFDPSDYDSIISIKSRLKRNSKGSWISQLGKCARTGLKTLELKRIALIAFAMLWISSCTRDIYQAKFTDTNAKFLYPSKYGKTYRYQIGDTIEFDSYRNRKRTAVIIGKVKGGKND